MEPLQIGDEIRINGCKPEDYAGKITSIKDHSVTVTWYKHSTNPGKTQHYNKADISDTPTNYFYRVYITQVGKRKALIRKSIKLETKFKQQNEAKRAATNDSSGFLQGRV
jgi:hypothetical protein